MPPPNNKGPANLYTRSLTARTATLSAPLLVFSGVGPFSAAGRKLSAAPSTAPAAPAASHDRIVADYLDGKWAGLETELGPAPPKPAATKPARAAAPATGPAADQADLDAIRKALNEGRPPWWKQVAQGKKVAFRPSVWGRTLSVTYDPAAKTDTTIHYSGAEASVTVKWDASDMDNPAPAEHGFSKGELNDLAVWMNLGRVEGQSAIGLRAQLNLNEQGTLLLSRYIDFRGMVTSIYYGSPRARRWGLWLGLAYYMDKYAKSQTVMARRAVGAMFVAEVVGHRNRYPSIRLPDPFPENDAEAKLAEHLRGWVERHPLPLAEDEALREAVKAFATANAAKLYQAGKVALDNGTFVSLDSDGDSAEAVKREDWLKGQAGGAGK